MNLSFNQLTQQWAQKKGVFTNYEPETTSTNDWAKRDFIQKNSTEAIYLADHQTQGRGRNENKWQDPGKGQALLSTWCFKVPSSPQPILTPLLGLGLFKALQVFNDQLALQIKPPNDILLATTKLSGLLVEVTQLAPSFYIHIGIGLNVTVAPETNQKTIALNQLVPNPENQWFEFCDALFDNWEQAIVKGQQKELTAQDQKELLIALNGSSAEKQTYLSVSPQCDLMTDDQVIPWSNL